MKYLRKFNSVEERTEALADAGVSILSYTTGTGMDIHIIQPTPPKPTLDTPFYIEDVSGSDNTITFNRQGSSAPTVSIEKSSDGETWSSIGSTSSDVNVTIPANSKVYFRSKKYTWATAGSGNVVYYNRIIGSSNFNVGGNILSLLYGDTFDGQTEFRDDSACIFSQLFYGSNKLISAANLLLPSTTLAYKCYSGMFSGCTSLTTAPELPATTLASSCYTGMFGGCTSLNYIKCLATNISASSCTSNWVNGVAATGTFVKAASMSTSTWGTGTSGIPEGWTVQDA